jgi:hypothetical protein
MTPFTLSLLSMSSQAMKTNLRQLIDREYNGMIRMYQRKRIHPSTIVGVATKDSVTYITKDGAVHGLTAKQAKQ